MCNRSLHSNNRRFEVERPKRHNFHLLTRLLISRGYLSPKRYDKLVLPPGGGGGGQCTCRPVYSGPLHTTLEKFKNGVFTLKTNKMFSVHTILEKILKSNNHRSFGFVFEEKSVKEIT